MARTKRATKRKKTKEKSSKQIKAIIFMALAVFLLAIVIIPTKNLGGFGVGIKDFCFGLFGFCAYIFPVVLGYIAIMLAIEKKKSNTVTIVFASIFALCLDTAFEIFGHDIGNVGFFRYIGDAYTIGYTSIGGGVFGSILGYPLTKLLGNPLSNITIIILIVVALMITTGTTLQRVGVFAKKTGEKAQQIHTETKEWLQQRQEVKMQEKENNKPKFNVDVPIDNDLVKPIKEKRAKKVQEEVNSAIDIPVDEPVNIKKLPVQNAEKPLEKAKPEKEVKKKKAKIVEIPSDMPAKTTITSKNTDYEFPPIDLLSQTKDADENSVDNELKSNCELLVNVLKSFGVEVRITGYSRGPSVTRYEIQPSVGVRISKITGLADDIALQLRAQSIRISPIPNKSSIGIEVPNKNAATVGMREIVCSPEFQKSKSKLLVALGKDVTGSTAFCDISKMPHLLVAGTTGSGKSVCLNTMIMSILYRATPDEVKFVMIDPKAVEFPVYNGIPHLLVPVVTDSRKAAGALGWAVVEMEKRYKTLAENGVRNIGGYNELCKSNPELEPMPHIVIIIDEFADLMMVAGNEVESSVCRLAQKARAAGMHLVIATQRPSADIFTGLIKSNIPSRIALSVSSKVNSQIIIDMLGAEKLLGKGDMLYLPIGAQKPHRIQGCFVSDEEVKNVSEFISSHSEENEYDQEVICEIERQAAEDDSKGKNSSYDDFGGGDYDARINEAIEVVVTAGMCSTSLLQRKLKLGYARAARIVDEMEEQGIVGPHQGSKPREVLITKQQWIEMQNTGVASAKKLNEPEQLSFEDVEADNDLPEAEPEVVEAENEPIEMESEPEEVVFTDDNEPSVHLDKDDDEDLDYIDEDFLNSI